jgi:glycosyltransferase involved in cell wall biosynthesis
MTTLSQETLCHDLYEWLEEFERKHKRPLRVLHIGNIANNAYINSKFLNQAGLQCDVLCYDYYHIMGCPEWEDVEFDPSGIQDQNRPNWPRVNLNGYSRPKWFVQGPLKWCLRYLRLRNQGKMRSARLVWMVLSLCNGTRDSFLARPVLDLLGRFRNLPFHVARSFYELRRVLLMWFFLATRAAARPPRLLRPLYRFGRKLLSPMARIFRTCSGIKKPSHPDPYQDFLDRAKYLKQEFARVFPTRKDRLVSKDLLPYASITGPCREVFDYYDIIIGYSLDGILPLLAGKRPYACFEHGTLRTFTMEPTGQCRRTALCYRLADHVFITNGDCIDYAERLNLPRYVTTLHPIDEKAIEKLEGRSGQIREELGVRHVFLCPLRHDWKIKGADIYIRALPDIRDAIGDDFRVLMTQWGADLQASKDLARQLGVFENILWSPPFSRVALHRMMKSVDIVFDQIALPHFGATAPEAIAAGTPVIMSYDPASTSRIVEKPAPILSAWSPQDVVRQVQKALEPAWRKKYQEEAAAWVRDHHSHRRILKDFLGVCRTVLDGEKQEAS